MIILDHALIACLEAAVLAGRQDDEASAYRIARAIHDLHKLGRQLHRRYEAECSSPYADTERYRKRTARLEGRAWVAASQARLTIAFQRDPRGWPIIIHFGGNKYHVGGAQ